MASKSFVRFAVQSAAGAAACLALAGSALAVPMATFAPLDTFGGGDGFIAGGERSYLTTGNTERGVAYNPGTNSVYVVSRATATPVVAVLNGDTGAEQAVVSLSGLTEGTFLASHIRVADDGAIYVANLTTGTTAAASYKVYRFADEAALLSNTRTLAFEGILAANERYGDNFNVRGGGVNTQLIAGGGSANNTVAILSTTNGTDFTGNTYTLPADGDAANGVAFGEGNTFYTKQVGDDLRLFSFSPGVDNSQALLTSYPAGAAGTPFNRVGPIDVDTVNTLLAGLSVTGTGPDSVRLYDISNTAVPPAELDTETFPVDVANTNVAGSLDFGNGRLYVLDTQNGLMALVVTVPEPASLGLVCVAAVGLLGRRRRA